MTEFLSLLKWLVFWPLFGSWILVLLLFLFLLIFGRNNQNKSSPNLQINTFSRFEIALIFYLFLIVFVIGIIAWVAPPNTWDSMAYHMSRVMHWIQNKSVDFFPTSILRQLHQNPWSEFAIMHFQILNDSDHFANFIQWFSMVGSLMGVSLLAKEFGAKNRGQIFAAVACATIPMGILQGSSTQTDYVVSFWLVCLVYFVIHFNKKADLLNAYGIGAALGLGILTKATMYIYAIPFLVWVTLYSIKIREVKRMRFIVLALFISFLLNFGHYARNNDLYHNPIGPGGESNNMVYANEEFTFSTATSNILRNIGLHLGTPFSQVNSTVDNAIFLMHKYIGISPDDDRTTWLGQEFHTPYLSTNEDIAGNLIHFILISVLLFLYLIQRSKDIDTTVYILSILFGFLLFCVYLKWQPWNSRLHLPLFVLFSTFIGLRISNLRHERTGNLLMIMLLMMALPWVFFNTSRPLLGKNSIFTTSRIQQYFSNRPSIAKSYLASTQVLSEWNCSDLGLIIGVDDWEYPLWVLLREKTVGAVHLEHVSVTNISKRKYGEIHVSKFTPCAIFTLQTDLPSEISIGANVYLQEWSYDSVTIYKRALNP